MSTTVTFELGKYKIPKINREYKGKSCIDFPSQYCVVDIETTGLDPNMSHIIEIGAIRYSNGEEIDSFQSLVRPPDEEYTYIDDDGSEIVEWVDSFITGLTGISNEMISTAPLTEQVIKDFSEYVGNDIIVGYNINFDINFLYDNFQKYLNRPFTNDYIDVMRMARKLHKELKHHRLKDMIKHFGIECDRMHRAVSDCQITDMCYKKLHEEAIRQFETTEEFIKSFIRKRKRHSLKASDVIAEQSDFNTDCPIYNKHCVFTGKLEKFTRKEAMQIVANIGGINEDRVTQKTNFLILGDNDYCTTIKGGKSSKQKKAEAYKLAGQDIDIISETVFYDMIADIE